MTADRRTYHREYMRRYRMEHPTYAETTRIQALSLYHATGFAARSGLTPSQYGELVASQSAACAICRCPFTELPKRPAIDHDHETGRVRGLLCQACNVGLGQFKDNTEALLRAVEYLRGPPKA